MPALPPAARTAPTAARLRRAALVPALAAACVWALLRVLGAQAAPPAAALAVRPYPGPAPCNTTIQACVDAANPGDTIQVAAGVWNTATVVVSKAITIAGAGPITTEFIPLAGQRAFSLTSGISGTVTLRGLSVRAASGPGPGGALISGVGSRLSVRDAAFLKNQTNGGGSGGAVFVQGPSEFVGVSFSDNRSSGAGGAIRASETAPLLVENSQFSNSHSFNPGGAIRASAATVIRNTGFFTATAGIVVPNPTLVNGGVLRLDGPALLRDVQVLDGRVTGSGGGIYATASLDARGLLIQRGVAVFDGGGIMATQPISATGLSVSSSRAGRNGGGVYLVAAATLTNTLLGGNEAAQGGGLYAEQPLVLRTLGLQSNRARTGGGAFFARGAQITAGSFEANAAEGASGVGVVPLAGGPAAGGAIFSGGPLTVDQGAFAANTATGGAGGAAGATALPGGAARGGAIAAVVPTGTVTLTAVLMENNDATGGAGGVAGGFPAAGGPAQGGAVHGSSLVVLGGAWMNNDARGGAGAPGGAAAGGAAYVDVSAVISGGSWITNTATGGLSAGASAGAAAPAQGGAISADDLISLTAVSLVNNIAQGASVSFSGGGPGGDGLGGAVIARAVEVAGGRFEGNQAAAGSGSPLANPPQPGTGSGGAVLAIEHATVQAGSFRNNHSSTRGGAIAIGPAQVFDSTLQVGSAVVNTLFVNNGAATGGRGDVLAFVGREAELELFFVHNTIDNALQTLNPAIYITQTLPLLPVVEGGKRVDNNIFVNAAVGIERGAGQVVAQQNLFFNVAKPISGTVTAGPILTGNPNFVNAAGGDYHIQPLTPAHNTAVDRGVLVDFEGEPRPQDGAPDIGMDEGGALVAPAFTTLPPLTGTVGLLYQYDAAATGAPPPLFSLVAAPQGMTVNAASGRVQFTPPAAGSYAVTLRADNIAPGAAEQSWTITVPQPLGDLAGRVFADLDGNGSQGPGEPGAAGVTVTVTSLVGASAAEPAPDAVALTRARKTDATGGFLFQALPTGVYVVSVTSLPGLLPPQPVQATVTARQTTTLPPLPLSPPLQSVFLPVVER